MLRTALLLALLIAFSRVEALANCMAKLRQNDGALVATFQGGTGDLRFSETSSSTQRLFPACQAPGPCAFNESPAWSPPANCQLYLWAGASSCGLVRVRGCTPGVRESRVSWHDVTGAPFGEFAATRKGRPGTIVAGYAVAVSELDVMPPGLYYRTADCSGTASVDGSLLRMGAIASAPGVGVGADGTVYVGQGVAAQFVPSSVLKVNLNGARAQLKCTNGTYIPPLGCCEIAGQQPLLGMAAEATDQMLPDVVPPFRLETR